MHVFRFKLIFLLSLVAQNIKDKVKNSTKKPKLISIINIYTLIDTEQNLKYCIEYKNTQ